MTSERSPRPVRFKREKGASFRPAEGSWESILVGLRDQYPENVYGMGESEHWEPIEKKASMSLRAACFQYFLAGKGHITLAGMVVDSNQQIKAAIALGTMSADEKEGLMGRLADFLYDSYPERYKEQVKS